MSTHTAKEFLGKVAGDQMLQEQLTSQAGEPSERLAAAVKLGRQTGYTFTSDELLSAATEDLGSGELNDSQSAQVVGGVSWKMVVGRIWGAIGGGSSGGSDDGNAVTGVRG